MTCVRDKLQKLVTFNCGFHGLIVLFYLFHFNSRDTEFLFESPSWDGKRQLDRTAVLLAPQEGIIYELREWNRRVRNIGNAKLSHLMEMSDNCGTHIISLQTAQDLFGLLFGLSLLFFNIDDRRGSHARSVSLIFISTCDKQIQDTIMQMVIRTLDNECLSSWTPTSLFHHHLRRSLFKNRMGLDDLWTTAAPASVPCTSTTISILPISPWPAVNLGSDRQRYWSTGRKMYFLTDVFFEWTYSSLTFRPMMLGVNVFYKREKKNINDNNKNGLLSTC